MKKFEIYDKGNGMKERKREVEGGRKLWGKNIKEGVKQKMKKERELKFEKNEKRLIGKW